MLLIKKSKSEKAISEYIIHHVFSRVYFPRENGQIERVWQTLKGTIGKNTKDYLDIDVQIGLGTFNVKSTKNKTTQESPNYLMFGFEPQSSQLRQQLPNVNVVNNRKLWKQGIIAANED